MRLQISLGVVTSIKRVAANCDSEKLTAFLLSRGWSVDLASSGDRRASDTPPDRGSLVVVKSAPSTGSRAGQTSTHAKQGPRHQSPAGEIRR